MESHDVYLCLPVVLWGWLVACAVVLSGGDQYHARAHEDAGDCVGVELDGGFCGGEDYPACIWWVSLCLCMSNTDESSEHRWEIVHYICRAECRLHPDGLLLLS